MDNYQCQICNDWRGRKYFTGVTVEVQAHHIIPRSEGGETTIGNLITLCDMCHAVLHKRKWREYFGDMGVPEKMEGIKREFEDYIKSMLRGNIGGK
jgi:5-methylcytosine-specific restriction endonuclease McrA